ncbi:MAG: mRNA capping enzyme, catalytic domain-containing protein [Benjaminiella poitrasii]|nr:MAG: mRNA capping enzyme, catalytic domain-containing protein [Benjaminiella poitrasii]
MPNSESILLPESIGKRVDPVYSKVLQARLSELLHSPADSFPGSQPVSFESKHLVDIEREDYFVCEKSDGVRYLLFFLHSSKGPASFLFSRNKHWYYIPNLLFPIRGRENEYLKDTIMDGELVLDTDVNKKTWRYLIFDLMVINGSPIIQRSFNTRLGMLQQDVIQPFETRMKSISDPEKIPPFTIELKKMERSYGLHVVFDQIPKLKHKSDGIIWTPVKYPYTSGTCEKLLKWKPPELNTVDFRISASWSKEHKPIYTIEVLSNGVTYKFYDYFQPEPALATEWKNHLPDGRIAEFRYDPEWEVTIVEQGYAPTVRKGGWRFLRFRDDKSTANDEVVVKKILNSIRDGVTKEQLLLCMDRVRAAWKAREKGLPMPPLSSKTSTNSVSPNQRSPSITSITTTNNDYFLDTSSRSNSISEEAVMTKRKTSTEETTRVEEITETIERKKSKHVIVSEIPTTIEQNIPIEEDPQPQNPPPKKKSSSNIHNLLTTSVEPSMHHFSQQPRPVHFINYHAENRQATMGDHVLIIRSESNSEQQATQIDTPQPEPPKRKNSQKSKLDFILN